MKQDVKDEGKLARRSDQGRCSVERDQHVNKPWAGRRLKRNRRPAVHETEEVDGGASSCKAL